MLHLSVKIIIPYKGLHLLLAIIPEEYIIIIYCHWEWQWETVLLYSIAKQRKGSDVDLPAESALSVMCMLILQKSLTVCVVTKRPVANISKSSALSITNLSQKEKKKADQSDEYKKVVKESAAVCGGTVKK